jgi:hypothetical protein
MFTDSINRQFITGIIMRDIRNIYRAQELIASKNIYITGRERNWHKRPGPAIQGRDSLLKHLQNPSVNLTGDIENITVENTIQIRLRFLDMQAHGNWKIYNRQVWGILYNNALQDIRAGCGERIRDWLGDELRTIFE